MAAEAGFTNRNNRSSGLQRRSTINIVKRNDVNVGVPSNETNRRISSVCVPQLDLPKSNAQERGGLRHRKSIDRPVNNAPKRRTSSVAGIRKDLESSRSGHQISRSTSLTSVDNSDYFSRTLKVPNNSSRCASSLSGIGTLENSTSNIWQEFEQHIMSIDTDSMHFQTKPTTSKGSDTLKALLEEELIKKNAFSLNVGKACHVNRFKENIKINTLVESLDEDDWSEKNGTKVKVEEPRVERQHNWNKVKMDLQDKHLEKKKSATVDGWKIISQTAPYLTDAEKARRVLYERYIEKPNAWLEGLKNYDKYKYIFEEQHDSNSNTVRGGGMATGLRHKKTMYKAGGDDVIKRPKTSFDLNRVKTNDSKKHSSVDTAGLSRPFTAVQVC